MNSCMLDVLLNKPVVKDEPKGTINVSNRADKPIKSIIKSVSWRIVGTLDTMLISYIITGKVTIAVSIGSVEVITKTVLYYFHERLWAHIHQIRLNILKRHDGKRSKFRLGKIELSSFRKNN